MWIPGVFIDRQFTVSCPGTSNMEACFCYIDTLPPRDEQTHNGTMEERGEQYFVYDKRDALMFK